MKTQTHTQRTSEMAREAKQKNWKRCAIRRIHVSPPRMNGTAFISNIEWDKGVNLNHICVRWHHVFRLAHHNLSCIVLLLLSLLLSLSFGARNRRHPHSTQQWGSHCKTLRESNNINLVVNRKSQWCVYTIECHTTPAAPYKSYFLSFCVACVIWHSRWMSSHTAYCIECVVMVWCDSNTPSTILQQQ